MTADRIIPCVCTPHPPTAGDSGKYGRPVFTVCGAQPHKQFWTIKCPVCGRGGIGIEEPSAYKALTLWNNIMNGYYRMENKEIIYEDDFEKYFDPMTGEKYEQYRSKWDEIY